MPVIDPGRLARAVEQLKLRGLKPGAQVRWVSEELGHIPPFEDLRDDELEALALAILEDLGKSRGSGADGVIVKRKKIREQPSPDLLTAPFRFARLNETVAKAPFDAGDMGRDRPLLAGYCGRIRVAWAVETPLLIGEQDKRGIERPLKLGNAFVIPGATLRGMVRATSEAISRARLFQVNRHHRYGVRDFKHYLFTTERQNDLLGGWLRRAPASEAERRAGIEWNYFLQPCDVRLIRIRDLAPAGTKDLGLFHLEWLMKKLDERYLALGQAKSSKDGIRLDFSQLSYFDVPERGECFKMEDDGQRGVVVCSDASPTLAGKVTDQAKRLSRDNPAKWNTFIDAAKLELARELDAQDALKQVDLYKKREAVFLETQAAEVQIDPGVFADFELAYTVPSKNKREPTGTYKYLAPLLEAERPIPIFYIGDLQGKPSELTFGLTRLFKRSHLNSVGDVLRKKHPAHVFDWTSFKPDWIENLFGYVYEKDELKIDAGQAAPPSDLALKGRVAFGFARLANAGKETQEPLKTIMSAPRASFAPFYLRGETKDWSADDVKLAGRKIYFPRFPVGTAEQRLQAQARMKQTVADRLYKRDPAGGFRLNRNGEREELGSEKVHSQLTFLEPATPGDELLFRGEIRLHNVSAAEVGLLLWALMHGGDPEKPYRHMIGREKTAGAGQTRVKSLKLSLVGNDDDAQKNLKPPAAWEQPSSDREGWLETGSQSTAPFLAAFDKAMGPDWPRDPGLLDFLGAARPRGGKQALDAGLADYLVLEKHKHLIEKTRREADTYVYKAAPDLKEAFLAAPRLKPGELVRPYLGG